MRKKRVRDKEWMKKVKLMRRWRVRKSKDKESKGVFLAKEKKRRRKIRRN